ncbi:MAG: calcium-binding protein, partial [Alphaproteobacteria bacterium]|nr:calcium-binding protein [Alphaproteobacteria bacterium]
AGADTLVASAGNTTLSGGNSTGNNVYFAGTGDKVLIGGGIGNDTIFAGRGESTVFGGEGADVFAFFKSEMDGNPNHIVVIGDFTVGKDKLVFDGYTNVSLPLPQQDSGSTTLTLPDGTKIILSGVSLTGGGV